ncbi:hypothetical protein K523DRAFT_406719, partial [Schizophyllum commune Tattone D]
RALLSEERVVDDAKRLERATAARATTSLPHPSPTFRGSGHGLASPQGDRRKIYVALPLSLTAATDCRAPPVLPPSHHASTRTAHHQSTPNAPRLRIISLITVHLRSSFTLVTLRVLQ